MKRNLLILFITAVLMVGGLFGAVKFLLNDSSGDFETMSVANQLYSAGHYQEAGQIYEQLVEHGMADSVLFYNLGNTYMAQGDLGRAVLNYQRAERLDPRDPDIQANLELARTQAADLHAVESPASLVSLSEITGKWLTLNETALLALVMWFTVGFLFLAVRQSAPGRVRSVMQYGVILGLIVLFLGGASLGARMYHDRIQPGGVIIADMVTLNSEPGEEYTTEYSLNSGTEVRLLETQGEWVRMVGPNESLHGWIPVESVEKIGWGDTQWDSRIIGVHDKMHSGV